MSGGIIRVKKKESEYFMALNAPFNDSDLSFGARGILAYLLSKPDNWQVYNEDLYNQSPASRTAIDRMLKELKDAGYLRRYQMPNDKGHRFWVTEIYEDRAMNPEWEETEGDEGEKPDYYPKARFPTVGKPERRKTRQSVDQQAENPTVGKPDDIQRTDSNKGLNKQITDLKNTTTTPAHVPEPKPEPQKSEFAQCVDVLVLKGVYLDSYTSQLVQDCFNDIEPKGRETKLDWFKYACTESAGKRAGWKYLETIIRGVNDSGGLSAHQASRKSDNSRGKRIYVPPQIRQEAPRVQGEF